MSGSTQIPQPPGAKAEVELRLPDLPQPLPPAPEVLRNKVEVLETWELVNELYEVLQDVKPEETQKRKKMMRAVAPPLLLGLKLIKKYATGYMLEHGANVATSTTPIGNDTVRAWLRVWTAAEVRFRRWTQDNSRERMRANDPNNNHTIRDLTQVYRAEHKLWWVALADVCTRSLKDAITKEFQVPTGQIPIQFLKRRLTTQGNCEYVMSALTMLERYATLVPAAYDVASFKWGSGIKDIQRQLDLWDGPEVHIEIV